jgi:SAM-dependent methyltransferase
MVHTFDKDYWARHWQQDRAAAAGVRADPPVSPHLRAETSGLVPGTALDAGCGAGAEATWLAWHGWQVTAVDISADALTRARERAATVGVVEKVRWVEADLGVWTPEAPFDLVTSHYAHPAMPQLDFYERIASWVAPGGTLLLVGHLQLDDPAGDGGEHSHSHDGRPPAVATVTAADVVARLDAGSWEIATAEESRRSLDGPDGREVLLRDVVVRAERRG